jgi:type VI secretion system secreted protein Hcp
MKRLLKKSLIGAACVAAYAIPFLAITGEASIFMKAGNPIGPGPSDGPKGYEGWITIDSFQFGGKQAVSFEGTKIGVSNFSVTAITLTKELDNTSLNFFNQMTIGSPIPEIEVHFLTNNSPPLAYLKLYLKDVYTSGVSWSSGGDRPSEALTLDWTSLKMEYYSTDSGKAVLEDTVLWSRLKF